MGAYLNCTSEERTKNIVVLGSAPSAIDINNHIGDNNIVLCINNAWKCFTDYDHVIYADDLLHEKKDKRHNFIKKGINSVHYLDAVSRFGGQFWCGFTMAITSQYWAMSSYNYSQIHMFACDMIYHGANTHFYGKGAADPLRRDITLQSLEAKSLRAVFHAFRRNTLILNISESQESRLAGPRATAQRALRHNYIDYIFWRLPEEVKQRILEKGDCALSMELNAPFDLNQDWTLFLDHPEAWDYVRRVDEAWLSLLPEIDVIQGIVKEYEGALEPS